jgi:signal transduction histidine kinase
VPAELVPKLFDPMTAGDRRRSKSAGLGLGLFITKHIVEAHGGSIAVDSSEPRGTTFTVRLPRKHPVASTDRFAAGHAP